MAALFDILRDARMLVAPRRAYYKYKTTDNHHQFCRHLNLLKQRGRQGKPYRVRAGVGC